MNAPTLPLLDEQTEQELAPPCEGVSHGQPCEQVATHAVHLRCPCRSGFHVLLCARCCPTFVRLIVVALYNARCDACGGRPELISVVPL